MAYRRFETDNAEYILVHANFAQKQLKHVDCLEGDELKNLDAIVLEMMVEPKAEIFQTQDMPLKGSPGMRSPYELLTNRILALAKEGTEIPLYLGDREIGANERMIYGLGGQLIQVALYLGMQKGIPRQVSYALYGLLAAKLAPVLSKWYLGNKSGETKLPIDNLVAIDNVLPPMPTGEMRYALLAAKIEDYLVPEVLKPRLEEKGEDRKPRIAIIYSPSGASMRHNLQNEKRRRTILAPFRALNWIGMYQPSLDAMVELTPTADGKDWLAKDHNTGVVLEKLDPKEIDVLAAEELAEGLEEKSAPGPYPLPEDE